jgi:hypothetical protein
VKTNSQGSSKNRKHVSVLLKSRSGKERSRNRKKNAGGKRPGRPHRNRKPGSHVNEPNLRPPRSGSDSYNWNLKA